MIETFPHVHWHAFIALPSWDNPSRVKSVVTTLISLSIHAVECLSWEELLSF